MPSTATHAYFSIDLYDRLNSNQKQLVSNHINKLKIFAQGPDVFFFYKFFCPKLNKPINKLGHNMHNFDTQLFFINLITEIKRKKLVNNPEVITFLYGFISHYVLDMTIHPYVIYKTGYFNPKDKATYKYVGGHTQLEVYIDAYLIQLREKVKPSQFKMHRFCFDTTPLSNELRGLIDEVFYKTFKEENISHKYEESIVSMKAFYKLLRNDRTGIKKAIYSISTILPFNINFKVLSYHIKLNKNDYYLNLSKDHWHHPLDESKIYHYSIIELYAIALSQTIKLINEVDKVLSGRYNINHLKFLFPDLSYLTGYDCKLGPGKHFSF